MSLYCAVLCPMGVYAQETVRQIITIDEVFALADQNSKSLQPINAPKSNTTTSKSKPNWR
ncbi:MAG: hypothetical protein EZS26_004072 [Candidatus Ordinivivax streblomastigis]|uniref:Uncharacterized protein n=1 Tax=Candidatus Ordinivivax streblomastigis TaxID=2540710 RepID=A0A5M8NSD4_9BACT|nr:MAG: hypothetical protein EZS26_004072 [Candidatus Ordinivivax streblomastigis]